MIKKFVKIIAMVIIMFATTLIYNQKSVARSLESLSIIEEPVKVGVFLMSGDDPYVYSIGEALKEIQNKNVGKVQYDIHYAQMDQNLQNKQVEELFQEKKVDLIFVNLVDEGEAKHAIDMVKERNMPIVFFGGVDKKSIESYNKAYWVGMSPSEGGMAQGEVVINLWNNKKESIDKNKDNILQYAMLTGPVANTYAIARTEYSIKTINKANIKTQELALRVGDWSEEKAKEATKALLLKFGGTIEMIIANNDAMAIGAIKALQENQYNIEGKEMKIEVVGFDGIEKAIDLIKKGVMSGTVIQDPYDYAEAFYTIGMNLVNKRNPIEGTEYKFEDSSSSIVIPHKGVVTTNCRQIN